MSKKISDLLDELEKTQEKTAEELLLNEVSNGEKSQEKTAKEKTAGEKTAAEKMASQAEEFGQIAAHSFFKELAAMGIAIPTNEDLPVPPVSQASRPAQSPVTIAGDADIQEAVGHDGYDKLDEIKAKITPDRVKHASVSRSIVEKIYNNLK